MATGNVFVFRMGAGLVGTVTREQDHSGEPQVLDTTNPVLAYGDPVKMVAGKIQALQAGDTATSIYGFLERPYPTQSNVYLSGGTSAQGFGNAAPVPGALCTIMRRGYMIVNVQGTTVPVAGGQIFIRVAGTIPSGGKLGGLEAVVDATPANTPALPIPNSSFKGAPDANNVTEISFNL